MKRLFRDTHADAERVLIEGLRRMSGAEKIARVFALRQMALSLSAARMREEGYSEREIRLRQAATWLSPELMHKALERSPGDPR